MDNLAKCIEHFHKVDSNVGREERDVASNQKTYFSKKIPSLQLLINYVQVMRPRNATIFSDGKRGKCRNV